MILGAAVLGWASAALALSPAEQRGFVFVKENCSRCHAIGLNGTSPLPIAPPFRTLHERYPIEDIAEALAESIVTGRPTMPQFQLDPPQIDDVISYLKSLEPPPESSSTFHRID